LYSNYHKQDVTAGNLLDIRKVEIEKLRSSNKWHYSFKLTHLLLLSNILKHLLHFPIKYVVINIRLMLLVKMIILIWIMETQHI